MTGQRALSDSSAIQFAVDESWPRLPDEWSYRDVSGVAVGPDDRVYALCPDEQRVIVLSRDGDVLGGWDLTENATTISAGAGTRRPEPPRPEAPRSYPHGLTVGRDGSVLCVDNQLNTIRRFTPQGELLATIGTPGYASATGATQDFRSVVRGAGPFNGPAAVAEAPDGDLYVADGYRNARVHCFSADGVLKFSWGEPGDGAGQFRLPHGLAITPDGEQVVVADRENNRLVFFNRLGTYLRQWTGFTRPAAIHIDQAGYLFVIELGVYATVWDFLPADEPTRPPSRCSIFAPSGDVVARWGSRNVDAAGTFFAPHCISTDSQGDIYVGETNRVIEQGRGMPPTNLRTVQKFVRF